MAPRQEARHLQRWNHLSVGSDERLTGPLDNSHPLGFRFLGPCVFNPRQHSDSVPSDSLYVIDKAFHQPFHESILSRPAAFLDTGHNESMTSTMIELHVNLWLAPRRIQNHSALDFLVVRISSSDLYAVSLQGLRHFPKHQFVWITHQTHGPNLYHNSERNETEV